MVKDAFTVSLHRHDAAFGLRVLLDVPLRVGKRGMTGERLHVAQAARRLCSITSSAA
jgi:hypothetical protein